MVAVEGTCARAGPEWDAESPGQPSEQAQAEARVAAWQEACSGPVLQLPEWLPKWEQ